jgi:hypothetical protein
MPLAPSALACLETAHRLFERLSGNPRSAKVLVSSCLHPVFCIVERAKTLQTVLERLKNEAYSKLHGNMATPSPSIDIDKEGQRNAPEPTVPPIPWSLYSSFSEANGGVSQSLDNTLNPIPETHENLMWPPLIDVHYRGLDDVPSYPDQELQNTIETEGADTHNAWQKFMEQFSLDKS